MAHIGGPVLAAVADLTPWLASLEKSQAQRQPGFISWATSGQVLPLWSCFFSPSQVSPNAYIRSRCEGKAFAGQCTLLSVVSAACCGWDAYAERWYSKQLSFWTAGRDLCLFLSWGREHIIFWTDHRALLTVFMEKGKHAWLESLRCHTPSVCWQLSSRTHKHWMVGHVFKRCLRW